MKKELLKLVLKNASNFKGEYKGDGNGLKLIEDLNYDSLDLINLIVDIERNFNMQFKDSDVLIDKLNDFNELYILIENRLNCSGQA